MNRTAPGEFAVRLTFHGDLPLFLKRDDRLPRRVVTRVLREKTSIKDAIEACGIPHPEIDLMLCDAVPVGFSHQLSATAEIDVYPVGCVPADFAAGRLQRTDVNSFVADGHLGKLVRNLRLLGVDVGYGRDPQDEALVQIAIAESRALLTRDRRLLMRAAIRDGYCLRSQNAEEQTAEVVRRFHLASRVQPYTRCLRCNGLLRTVSRGAVYDQLEPLTRLYYEEFRRCADCGAVYWPGSHFEKLQARIERIMGSCGAG